MLKSRADNDYDFWVYICPLDTEFSGRAAVARLRKVASENVVPWGVLKVDGSPIVEQLIKLSVQTELPTLVGEILGEINSINQREDSKLVRAQSPKVHLEYAQ